MLVPRLPLARMYSDVALVSESLKEGPLEGFQVLTDLRSYPATRSIALLKSAPNDLVVDAFRAGAKGVFCRVEPVKALCKCIQVVHSGQIWVNSHQLNFIMEALVNAAPLRLTDAKGRYLVALESMSINSFG